MPTYGGCPAYRRESHSRRQRPFTLPTGRLVLLQSDNESLVKEWESADAEMHRVQVQCQVLEREVAGRRSGWEEAKKELALHQGRRQQIQHELDRQTGRLDESERTRQEAEARLSLVAQEVVLNQAEVERLRAELVAVELRRQDSPETLRIQKLLQAIWPNVKVSKTAADQLAKACRKSHPYLCAVCQVIARMETSGGRLDGSQLGVQVKDWEGASGFLELKKPPYRVIIRREGSAIRVEYVEFYRDSTTMKEISRYVQTHAKLPFSADY